MARQALSHPVLPLTFEAGVDLTSYIHRFVSMSSDQQIDPTAANGAGYLGILEDVDYASTGGAAGDECRVLTMGVGVLEMSEACNPGAFLSSAGASGKGAVIASGERRLAIALEAAGADGDLISVLIIHGGILA